VCPLPLRGIIVARVGEGGFFTRKRDTYRIDLFLFFKKIYPLGTGD
jgi:hypothetical protein